MSNAAMHVAKTGVEAQQLKMQVIANNLANVNTTGFKKDRVNFETLVYQIKLLFSIKFTLPNILDKRY